MRCSASCCYPCTRNGFTFCGSAACKASTRLTQRALLCGSVAAVSDRRCVTWLGFLSHILTLQCACAGMELGYRPTDSCNLPPIRSRYARTPCFFYCNWKPASRPNSTYRFYIQGRLLSMPVKYWADDSVRLLNSTICAKAVANLCVQSSAAVAYRGGQGAMAPSSSSHTPQN
jgi:hypothetical protein